MIKVYIDFPSLFWEGTFYQKTCLGFSEKKDQIDPEQRHSTYMWAAITIIQRILFDHIH